MGFQEIFIMLFSILVVLVLVLAVVFGVRAIARRR